MVGEGMDNYDFIESGLIFALTDREAFRKFRYTSKDFSTHGDAFKFLTTYFDEYGHSPSTETLLANYPTLNDSASSLDLQYAVNVFQAHVLFRQIVTAFQSNKTLLQESPKQALAQINTDLNDISVIYDEDVIPYNQNSEMRLTDWKLRKEKRRMGDGIMGVPTPFNSLNRMGVGWMPGELIALFARPTVGKSWMCVQMAVTAVMNGFKTLLVSTEMPVNQMNLRTDVVLGHAMGYQLSHSALRNGDPINEEEYATFLKDVKDKPLLVCDHIEGESSISLESLQNLIRKYNPELVVIDGIYLVTNSGKNHKAMWEQTHMLFYGLKNLCLSTNTPIFVSTQATKDASDVFIPPRADQVAYGDAMLRAADVALSMCMVEGEDQSRIAYFHKYRDGVLPFSSMELNWNVDKGSIYEVEDMF